MAEPASPPAMIDREPRQAWKGAAATVDSGAGVWLAGGAAKFYGRSTDQIGHTRSDDRT